MKPVYRCEYCDFTGIAEKVQEHEEECIKNYNKKSCMTCKYCSTNAVTKVTCKKGIEIPENKYMEKCSMHEVGTPEVTGFMRAFGDMFN